MANYIAEAFKKLDCLDEELFELSKEGTEKLKDFLDDDIADETVEVIDMEADDEGGIEDSYVGKVILNCPICHTMHYADKDKITYDEDSDLVDISVECPYCHDVGGFEVIGEVAPYSDVELEVENKTEEGEKGDKEEVKVSEKEDDFTDEEGLGESLKEGRKVTPRTRDDIDAIADNKKEKARARFMRKKDDADSDRDYQLKKNGLKESPIYGLNTQFDSRKSFGGKAQVEVQGDKETLYSYDTPVAVIEKGEVTLLPKWDLSATTLRHVKEFLKQHGFKADSRNQIASDYPQNMEESCGKKKLHETGEWEDDEEGIDWKKTLKDLIRQYTGKNISIKDIRGFDKYQGPYYSDGSFEYWTDGDYELFVKSFADDNWYKIGSKDAWNDMKSGKLSPLEESCGKSVKKTFKKVKEDKTSKTDRIDAKRDNRVEKARKALKKTIDDADAQRDDEKKEIKEGLSYGELATIADEWEKFKKKVGHSGADVALEFVDKECAGVYDTDEEKEEVFSYIGTLEESCKSEKCSKKDKKVEESVEKIEVETDKEKIRIETEKKEEGESKDEMIVPASDETIEKIKSDEISLDDIDEVDEEQIDELGESYLKRVYENVNSFKSKSCKLEDGKLIVEGVIGFKSGKNRDTSFMFESVCKTKTGKVKILGENKGISNCKRAFTFTGKVDGSKFIAESLTYKYNAKENKDGNAKRIYGRVLVGKK